ncbi:hypothetical protein [Methylobacterium sp. ARG-1]|uniref:phosphatase domain-containing protein n=1 Tax=Methylobacterium sp. ARG-1 TaxID=1692501 RepID=UPI00067FC520|nr:hypothetical protein [Methylobacterium sp. ARG-1]
MNATDDALELQISSHMRKPMFVVFDLDGTLALTEHRAHFLNRPGREKDWRGFYAACDQDQPCHPIIRTLLALDATGAQVEIWSGRSDEVKDKTTVWLAEHGLGHIPIRTRAAGDHRPDTVLKAEWLDEGRTPALVFEDRASMVAMYRARGIVCCQVAPGDF